jgi:NADH:ubiquinone oxidoreductase subunit 2 (subunit N)
MSVVSVFYYIKVLIPIWTPSARMERVPVSVSSRLAIVLSGVASLGLGLYPTTLFIAGQLGAGPLAP